MKALGVLPSSIINIVTMFYQFKAFNIYSHYIENDLNCNNIHQQNNNDMHIYYIDNRLGFY